MLLFRPPISLIFPFSLSLYFSLSHTQYFFFLPLSLSVSISLLLSPHIVREREKSNVRNRQNSSNFSLSLLSRLSRFSSVDISWFSPAATIFYSDVAETAKRHLVSNLPSSSGESCLRMLCFTFI